MILQDFYPLDHTLAELVNFCERLELTELEVEKKSSFKNESSSSSSSGKKIQERKGKLDSRGIAIPILKETVSYMAKTAVTLRTSVVQ